MADFCRSQGVFSSPIRVFRMGEAGGGVLCGFRVKNNDGFKIELAQQVSEPSFLVFIRVFRHFV